MAKENDVVFSSEKLESQERLKRILIPVIALIAVIAIAVAASFVVRHMRGKVYSGGEDTAYPYTWRNSAKGVMTLEIDNKAGNGRNWIALNNNPAYIPVEPAAKQPEGKNRFTATPNEEGRYSILFALVDETVEKEKQEASAVLTLLTETVRNGKGVLETEVLSASITERQTGQSRGGDTYYPYTYRTDTNGFLIVSVAYPEGTIPEEETETEETAATRVVFPEDWEGVTGNDSVASFAGIFYENGGITAYITSGTAAGTCRAELRSELAGVSIVLGIERNAEGALLVRSDEIRGGDAPYEEEIPTVEEEPAGGEEEPAAQQN